MRGVAKRRARTLEDTGGNTTSQRGTPPSARERRTTIAHTPRLRSHPVGGYPPQERPRAEPRPVGAKRSRGADPPAPGPEKGLAGLERRRLRGRDHGAPAGARDERPRIKRGSHQGTSRLVSTPSRTDSRGCRAGQCTRFSPVPLASSKSRRCPCRRIRQHTRRCTYLHAFPQHASGEMRRPDVVRIRPHNHGSIHP